MSTYIKGLDKVLNNLNKEILAIRTGAMQGLVESAIIIRRDMDDTPPLIPVEHGNLRLSYYTDAGYDAGGGPRLRLGFTAMYAWYVHEMIGRNFKRPGAGPKFMEAALKRNTDVILETIRKFAHRM